MKDERNLKILLRYWRKRRGKSIGQLSKEAHVSTSTITKTENIGTIPRADVVNRLAQALGITVDQLIVDESESEAERVA